MSAKQPNPTAYPKPSDECRCDAMRRLEDRMSAEARKRKGAPR